MFTGTKKYFLKISRLKLASKLKNMGFYKFRMVELQDFNDSRIYLTLACPEKKSTTELKINIHKMIDLLFNVKKILAL